MTRSGRPRLEDLHPEIIRLLGRATDTSLAADYGCTTATIAAARRRLGISRYDQALLEHTEDDDSLYVLVADAVLWNGDVAPALFTSRAGCVVIRWVAPEHEDNSQAIGALDRAGMLVHFMESWEQMADFCSAGIKRTDLLALPLSEARKHLPGVGWDRSALTPVG